MTVLPNKARGPDPTIVATLELLCEMFPRAFRRHEVRRRPLKIGIHHDLRAALNGAVTDDELRRALRVYCANTMYRNGLIAGATRIDLDGNPAGTVSAEHAGRRQCQSLVHPSHQRRHYLSHRRLWQRPNRCLSPLVSSIKRASLQDLRAAAAQRRKVGG